MSQATKSFDPLRRRLLGRTSVLLGGLPLLSACGGGSAAQTETTLQASGSTDTPNPQTPASPTPPGAASAPSTGASTPPLVAQTPSPAVPAAAPLPAVAPLPRPAWADAVPLNTWHTLPGTAFKPWAQANIPPGAYEGYSPFESIVDAFTDPATDASAGVQYFFGGGHGSGTCNAVCGFDMQTLSWRLAGRPTPPSAYLPATMNGTYPSGLKQTGFFLSANELSSPLDLPYAAPALARAASHMYGAAVVRGSRIHYFYGAYAEFDTATGEWTGYGVDLGAQLLALNKNYTSFALQQGTMAVYDEVTDRMYVTLVAGDQGLNWRNGLIQFNPNTRQIETVHGGISGGTNYLSSVSIVRVGRRLYVFEKSATYPTRTMNTGLIFDMDTKARWRFRLQGDTLGSEFTESSKQETIPAFFDGTAIRRWNYRPADRARMYTVNLQPLSGTGTATDAYVLSQTVADIQGTPPTDPTFVYGRFFYHSGAGCALLLPSGKSDWMALKLA